MNIPGGMLLTAVIGAVVAFIAIAHTTRRCGIDVTPAASQQWARVTVAIFVLAGVGAIAATVLGVDRATLAIATLALTLTGLCIAWAASIRQEQREQLERAAHQRAWALDTRQKHAVALEAEYGKGVINGLEIVRTKLQERAFDDPATIVAGLFDDLDDATGRIEAKMPTPARENQPPSRARMRSRVDPDRLRLASGFAGITATVGTALAVGVLAVGGTTASQAPVQDTGGTYPPMQATALHPADTGRICMTSTPLHPELDGC